ncbi:MAG TPA: hypothetical protein VKS99_11400, partial [Blastocatellia bacterium]|nr:hypothetical protein [Blastocatellia bacterium]
WRLTSAAISSTRTARDCGLGVGTLVIIERARRRGRLAFLHLTFDLGGEFYHRDTSGGKAPRSAF